MQAEKRSQAFYQPIDSSITLGFAGPSTFMRLPIVSDARETDIPIFGVPWDGGTTNRPWPASRTRQSMRSVQYEPAVSRRDASFAVSMPRRVCARATERQLQRD